MAARQLSGCAVQLPCLMRESRIWSGCIPGALVLSEQALILVTFEVSQRRLKARAYLISTNFALRALRVAAVIPRQLDAESLFGELGLNPVIAEESRR